MTKPINLYQFAKGLSTDDEELASLFEKVASERACRLSRIKSREIESLLAFVNGVVKRDQRYLTLLDGFVYAFSIPHISKEFDLLKIGQSSLVNIELKSERKSEFDLRKQLKQNAYYLSSLQKKTSLFEYISSEDKLYRLDEGGDLREETWQSLLDSVASVRSPYVDDY